MKKSLLLISLISLFTAVFAVESPEFIRTKNWEIEEVKSGSLVLNTTAVFYNPNKAKAKLKEVDIAIFMGETKIGKVRKSDKKVKIRKKSAFDIPMRIELQPETNAWGYLSGLMSAITLQDATVTLRGKIRIRVLGLPVGLKLDETEDINLRMLF